MQLHVPGAGDRHNRAIAENAGNNYSEVKMCLYEAVSSPVTDTGIWGPAWIPGAEIEGVRTRVGQPTKVTLHPPKHGSMCKMCFRRC